MHKVKLQMYTESRVSTPEIYFLISCGSITGNALAVRVCDVTGKDCSLSFMHQESERLSNELDIYNTRTLSS